MSALRTRDLASHDLWERSLHRSRERRRVAAIHRKNAPRRKGVSLAVSAALLTTPVLPGIAAAEGGSGPAPTGDTGGGGRPVPPKSLLKFGSEGSAVRKIQQALGLIDDGIFGPQTREAVLRFQHRAGLARTGKVDNGTWMAIFSSNVTVLDAGTPEADAVQAAAGDTPLEPVEPISTAPLEGGADPATDASVPAVFTASLDTPARKKSKPKKTTKPSRPSTRADDTPAKAKRTPARKREKTSDSGDSTSSSCGGALRNPIDGGGTITGVFGDPRGGGRSHAGEDIAAPTGTPIKAATCGRVTTVEYEGGYGNIVCIRASSSFTTCYAHMSRFGTEVGRYVRIGQVIGYVGTTGDATGPHVHFEVRINGSAVNPAPYLSGSKKPSGRSMAVKYAAVHTKKRDAAKPKDKGVAAIVKEERDANREAGGVPAPPAPTPGQQPAQAAPPAAGPQQTPAAPAPEQGAPGASAPEEAPAPAPADDGSGVVDDTTDGVTNTVDGTTDDSGSSGDGTTDSGSTGDGSSDGGTTDSGSTGDGSSGDTSSDDGSGVVEDTSGTVDDTVGDVTGADTSGGDGSGQDPTASEDPAPSDDTSGQDPAASEDPAPSDDTSGQDPAASEDPAPSDDTSGQDPTASEDPAPAEDTSGDQGDGGAEDPGAGATEDPAGTVQDTVDDAAPTPVGG